MLNSGNSSHRLHVSSIQTSVSSPLNVLLVNFILSKVNYICYNRDQAKVV